MTPAGAETVKEFEDRLAEPAPGGTFSEDDLEGLPEPVRRYLRASIAPGTPLARAARFAMRGSIKLGSRWLRFRGHEVLAPHRGLVWAVRAGGVITGSDRYLDGEGSMDWKILGLLRVVHADGPDISRRTAGRVGAEAVWLPTALLPRFGVSWTASDEHHISCSYRLREVEIGLDCELDDEGRLRSAALERWGDPDSTGNWDRHPFGFEGTEQTASAA